MMTDREIIRLATNLPLELTRAFAANSALPQMERQPLDRVAEPVVIRFMRAVDPALPLDGVQVLALVNGFAVTVLHVFDEVERADQGRRKDYLSKLATVTADFQQRLERLAATAPESSGLGKGGDHPCCQ
jgi:hypothetical protein